MVDVARIAKPRLAKINFIVFPPLGTHDAFGEMYHHILFSEMAKVSFSFEG